MNINLTIDIMGDYFVYLISIPKTLYFNLRTLPFKDAIKLPFIVRYDTKLDISCGDGGVILKQSPRFNMVHIGFSDVSMCDPKATTLIRITKKWKNNISRESGNWPRIKNIRLRKS